MTATNEWTTHRVAGSEPIAQLVGREWLLTNGTGAYSAGTAAGVNTRRYHGLLIAATRPPVGRVVALSQVLDQLILRDAGENQAVAELASCLFPTDTGAGDLPASAEGNLRSDGPLVFAPRGVELLDTFTRGAAVAWTYAAHGATITRTLHLHWKQQAATIRSTAAKLGKRRATLRLSPMLTLRDFHAVTRQGKPIQVRHHEDTIVVTSEGVTVTLRCRGAKFVERSDWWRNLYYPLDHERGQEDREDALAPGYFEVDIKDGGEVTLTVALGHDAAEPVRDDAAREQHLAPLAAAMQLPKSAEPWRRTLALAADDFVVDRTLRGQQLSTIIAGYPWFADWGRDTMIAMRGLLLATGRHDEAGAVLKVFAESLRGGLVPNRFDDYDEQAAHYNTVDASLWFVQAALDYLDASGDYKAWEQWLGAACRKVVDAYIKGTDFGIRMAGDGLITAGSPSTQLTWMDAACNGVVFTPRPGKAIEINALWHGVLLGMAAALHESDRPTATHYTKLAARVKRAFLKVFWDDHRDAPLDHVWTDDAGVDHVDPSIRPNMIFAAALDRSPLPLTKQKRVVEVVRQHLLTPFGLRTLPVDDPNYHALFTGPAFERDKAYHQGTIWPWLIGPYAEAVLRVGKFAADAKTEALAAVTPLLEAMAGRGAFPMLGQLHEVHEALPPHRPAACFAQAWSVAEVARVLTLIARGK